MFVQQMAQLVLPWGAAAAASEAAAAMATAAG